MPSPQAESLISKVLKRKDLPETLKNTITEDYDAIHSLLTTSPVLPPHNDLHGRNILIGRSKLTFIDFELCENLPFFFDPLKLPLTEAYRHNAKILHLLLKKQFKEEWDAILSVAKMPRDFKLNQYLLAYLIIRLTQNSPWPGDPSLLWDAIYHHTAS